ncbi:sulfite exporter TauE/SafE family protein [Porticoccus sp. W117]|uniref:sulfite exporter TauE/SafE family protein n=1 Tax=Porticoccus sp. W117 TaxID=3054777 RepID=UPI002596D317|nr:sulfite exporter TauE/SafE family protein [Porticoccus sp. W117]MDM3871642.1 sulfite exporter TauE/SafE family protein [Porticoccus sp. W117]
MIDTAVLAGLVAMGVSSGAHCIGMCGGIAAALGFAVDPQRTSLGQRLPVLLSYNLGRVVSYSVAGALVGLLGELSRQLHSNMMVILRTLAAVLLVMMAFYLADWWRGLVRLEKLGSGFWRLLQPLGSKLMPVRTPGGALLLGMVWGWLPCGLVYSALALAATTGNPAGSALGMAIFGLLTIPAMLAGGIFSDQVKRWLQNRTLRTVMALLLLGFAGWVFWTGAGHVLAGDHSEGDLHCLPWH